MDNLINNRMILQSITFLLAIASMVVVMMAIHKSVIPWRYLVFPVTLLTQIILFYGYILATMPTPSPSATFWSGVIRFQFVAGFLVALILLYKERA